MEIRQLLFDKMVPVVLVERVPHVPPWRRQPCSHGCTRWETRCFPRPLSLGTPWSSSLLRRCAEDRAGSRVHRDTTPGIRCRTVWRHGETRRHNRPPPPQPPPEVALLFGVDRQVDQVACTSGWSDDGWTRRRRRHRWCPPLERATPLFHVAA